MKKRKKNPWRSFLTLLFLASLITVVIMVAIWASRSPYFDLRFVNIEGLNYLPEEALKAKIADIKGQNFFRLKIRFWEESIEKFPEVKQARIYRSFPKTVYIKIVEREPLALFNSTQGLMVLDTEGELIAPPRAGEIYDNPLIAGCAYDSIALKEASQFLLTLKTLSPAIYDSVSQVGLFGASRILSAELGASASLVKIGFNDYPEKILKLWILMNKSDLVLSSLEYADVRFHQKIYFRRRGYGNS